MFEYLLITRRDV